MQLTPDLAEIAGTLIGDGCLSKYFVKKENRFRYVTAFTGSNDEFEYYYNFVQPVIMYNFGVKGRLYLRSDNSTRYHVVSKKVFDFFSNLGIPVGKKSFTVFIPKAILSDFKLLAPCLKGIWDTDGSIYQRYSRAYANHPKHYSKLLSMQYKSVSKQLVHDICNGLTFFGINTSNVVHSKSFSRLYITHQKEIHKFLDLIGFRNQHHLNRLAFLLPDKPLKSFPRQIDSSGPVAQFGRAPDSSKPSA